MKKYYLICGPIMALGIMAGTAMDNIKIGVALGIAVGVALSTLAILFGTCRQK